MTSIGDAQYPTYFGLKPYLRQSFLNELKSYLQKTCTKGQAVLTPMLKFFLLTGTLSAAVLTSFIAEATLTREASAVLKLDVDTPVCYMQTENGRTVNLSQLCANKPRVANTAKPLINLEQDANGDGTPDALAEEVKRIESAQDKDAAIKDFLNRLPYSPETRALQQQAEQLHSSLAQAQDTAQAQAVINQLRSIELRMMADLNYIRTTEGLQKMFAPSDVNRTNTTVSSRQNEQFLRSLAWASHSDKRNTLLAFAGLPGSSISDVGLGIFSQPDAVPPAQQHIAAVDWGALRRGHIMLVRSGRQSWTDFIYAMTYSHVGNYDGNRWVYESNSDGVRLKPLSNWQQTNNYVALGYNNKRSTTRVQNALNWAKGRYGTDGRIPYNYNYANKSTDSRLYCSQLTWKIHKNVDVDVDSNHWSYLTYISARWGLLGLAVARAAVAPDEVALDSDVTVYATAWN